MKEDDPLEDFAPREIAFDGVARRVYVAGRGPAVIVMSEMPGISPEVARFARWVRDAGFAVYMPSLFGRDGAVPRTEEGLAVFRQACVSAEFRAFAAGQPTIEARDDILAFFTQRLVWEAGAPNSAGSRGEPR